MAVILMSRRPTHHCGHIRAHLEQGIDVFLQLLYESYKSFLVPQLEAKPLHQAHVVPSLADLEADHGVDLRETLALQDVFHPNTLYLLNNLPLEPKRKVI